METLSEPDDANAGLHERLYKVYKRLSDTVTDERGYGGPVSHVAEVDGWSMRVATSESGELMVSAIKSDEKIFKVFEYGPDGLWYPMTSGTQPDDFTEVLYKAECAEWQDELSR